MGGGGGTVGRADWSCVYPRIRPHTSCLPLHSGTGFMMHGGIVMTSVIWSGSEPYTICPMVRASWCATRRRPGRRRQLRGRGDLGSEGGGGLSGGRPCYLVVLFPREEGATLGHEHARDDVVLDEALRPWQPPA